MTITNHVFPEAMQAWCAERGADPTVTELGDIYPELRAGATLAVDWSALPKRAHSFLSTDFPTWSAFANATVAQLLTRLNVGIDTVRSVLHELDRLHAAGILHADEAIQVPAQPADVFPVLEWSALRKWVTWRRAGSPSTLRGLLAIGGDELPGDIASVLDRLLDAPIDPNADTAAVAPDLVAIVAEHLHPKDFEILSRRRWTPTPETLEKISESFDQTRERIRQLQNRGLRNMATLAEQDDMLRWTAHHLRHSVGTLATTEAVDAALTELGITPGSTQAYIALHIAGDYEPHGSGLHAPEGIDPGEIVNALDSQCTETGYFSDAEAHGILLSFDVRPHSFDACIERLAGYRRLGDRWYQWRGTAADKAAAVLRSVGTSLTSQQVTDLIDDGYSTTSVQNAMSVDDRFVRTTKTQWDLRERGAPAYEGIVNNLFAALEANGGTATTEWLVQYMVTTFAVSEVSVRLYLGTLAFVVEGGIVRRRTDADPWTYTTALAAARGAFALGGRVRVLVPVTGDALRGSGQSVHTATAAALGITPGGRRVFTSGAGAQVPLNWRPWSTAGPDLGSIRSLLTDVGAQQGDHVVLTFEPAASAVSAVRLPQGCHPGAGLGAVVGGTFSVAVLSAAVDVEVDKLVATLRRRGDDLVVDWLESGGYTP